MGLLKDIMQKTDSIVYKVRAAKFRNSHEWRSSAANKPFPKVDWEDHDGQIRAVCAENGVEVKDFSIDKSDFDAFKQKFKLPLMSLYALRCKEKKMMEHFIAYRLLDMKKDEIYVDIASENSPFPAIFRRQLDVDSYSQDLTYSPGFQEKLIGSSADDMPVNKDWIDKASLQCAFEHFMGDVDRNFMREMARTLKPGGKCVIVPLYTSGNLQNIYDPILFDDWDDSLADADSEIYAEIGLGGHFERNYSPESLTRIFIPDIGLRYTLFRITDKEAAITDTSRESVGQVKRIRYAVLIAKPSAN